MSSHPHLPHEGAHETAQLHRSRERLLSDGIPRGQPKRELPSSRAARSEQPRLAQSGWENLSGSLDLVDGSSAARPSGAPEDTPQVMA